VIAILSIYKFTPRYWQIPYYWAGCKLYDLLAGKENMEGSYLMTRGKALEAFPMLKQDGLVGAIVYYDGMYLIVMKKPSFLTAKFCRTT